MTAAVTTAYSGVNTNPRRTPVYRATFARSGRKYSTHPICDYFSEVMADAPSLFLRLNESSGTSAFDSSGNGLTGTYHGTLTLGAAGPLTGSSQTAAALNGSTQYVTVPDGSLVDPGDVFSFELQVKVTSTSGDQDLLDKGTNGYIFRLNSGGIPALFKNGVGALIASSSLALSAGSYFHLVVTKSGAACHIYVNGADVTIAGTNAAIVGTATALNIGRNSVNVDYVPGSMANVAIYPSALSAARILAHYNAANLGGNLGTWLDYMQLPSGIAAQVIPEKGQSSIGSTTFVLEDNFGDATGLIAGGIGGDLVTLEGGFDSIQGEEFATFATGIVADYKMTQDLTGYEITVQDPGTLVNKQIFDCAASKTTVLLTAASTDLYTHTYKLAVTGDALQTSTNQLDATGMAAALTATFGAGNFTFVSTTASIGSTITIADAQFFIAGTGYVQLESEIIQFTGKTATTLTGLTRGALGTIATPHAIGTAAREIIVIGPGHICDLIQGVYANTDKTGCGIDSSLVDATTFAAVKASMGTANAKWIITGKQNAKTFLETEGFAIAACYPVNRGGLLSIREFAEPADGDAVATLDHDSIIADSDGSPHLTWDGNFVKTVNSVTVNYDWDPVTQQYASSFTDKRADSIALYGLLPLPINSAGLRSDLSGTSAFIQGRTTLILDRYAGTAPIVTARTFLQKDLIEPGDVISLTSDLLPNRFAGLRGIDSSLFEVIQRAIDFAHGYVDFTLLWTSFSLLSKDDFTRADTAWDATPFSAGNSIGNIPLWGGVSGSFDLNRSACANGAEIHSNTLRMGNFGAGAGGYVFVIAWQVVSNGAGDENQISEVTFDSASGGKGGPVVRAPENTLYTSFTSYAAIYDATGHTVTLYRMNAVDLTAPSLGVALGSPYSVTLTAGDRLRIHINGTTLTVLLNDAAIIGPIVDLPGAGVLIAGNPGILESYATGSINWRRWRGGADGWA